MITKIVENRAEKVGKLSLSEAFGVNNSNATSRTMAERIKALREAKSQLVSKASKEKVPPKETKSAKLTKQPSKQTKGIYGGGKAPKAKKVGEGVMRPYDTNPDDKVEYVIYVFPKKDEYGFSVSNPNPRDAFDDMIFDTPEEAQAYADKNYPDAEQIIIRDETYQGDVSGAFLQRVDGKWGKVGVNESSALSRSEIIAHCQELGAQAQEEGRERVPAKDKQFIDYMRTSGIGDIFTVGNKTFMASLDAWFKGYDGKVMSVKESFSEQAQMANYLIENFGYNRAGVEKLMAQGSLASELYDLGALKDFKENYYKDEKVNTIVEKKYSIGKTKLTESIDYVSEYTLSNFDDLMNMCWSGALDRCREAQEKGVEDEFFDYVESLCEANGSEPITDTEINDIVWFETDDWLADQGGSDDDDYDDIEESAKIILDTCAKKKSKKEIKEMWLQPGQEADIRNALGNVDLSKAKVVAEAGSDGKTTFNGEFLVAIGNKAYKFQNGKLVKTMPYSKNESYEGDMAEVATKYCKTIGAEVLFVNPYEFGYETKDHQLLKMSWDELAKRLGKVNEGWDDDDDFDDDFDESKKRNSKALTESREDAIEQAIKDYYGADINPDFLNVFADIVDRALLKYDSWEDVDYAVGEALDDGLIYTDDQETVANEYDGDTTFQDFFVDVCNVVEELVKREDLDESVKADRDITIKAGYHEFVVNVDGKPYVSLDNLFDSAPITADEIVEVVKDKCNGFFNDGDYKLDFADGAKEIGTLTDSEYKKLYAEAEKVVKEYDLDKGDVEESVNLKEQSSNKYVDYNSAYQALRDWFGGGAYDEITDDDIEDVAEYISTHCDLDQDKIARAIEDEIGSKIPDLSPADIDACANDIIYTVENGFGENAYATPTITYESAYKRITDHFTVGMDINEDDAQSIAEYVASHCDPEYSQVYDVLTNQLSELIDGLSAAEVESCADEIINDARQGLPE